ncbi:MAG: helix-turn-helix transcriptional regulator [Gemmatimonadota bacterium]
MAAELASDQLERILYLLPRAAQPEGVPLAELAAEVGVTEKQILRDIEEVTSRAYYHPAGWVTDLEILVERGRVKVWTTGEFKHPVRLSPREALALALGLRMLAEGAGTARREELLALAARLDAGLAAAPAEPMAARFALDGGDPHGNGMLATVRDAAVERCRCRIRYLKPGEAEPETRLVAPYELVFSAGRWYILGHSEEASAVRAFRLDRVLEADSTDQRFEVPEDFEPEDHLERGAVFRAGEEIEAVVRYSPLIARWIAERGEVEERRDGSVIVCHRVADPRWIVRHVLAYGAEAELLEPEGLRDLVRETVEAVATREAR